MMAVKRINCYICSESCSDINVAFKHLKTIHSIKERVNEIICFNKCGKKYATFRGLRSHFGNCIGMKTIDTSISTENVNEVNIRPVEVGEEIYVNLNSSKDKSITEAHSSIEHKFEDAYDKLNACVDNLTGTINKFNFKHSETDYVYQLISDLISEMIRVLIDALKTENTDKSLLFKSISVFISEKLGRFKSKHRRHKQCESNAFYVAPEERAIGTRFEMRADKNQTALPTLLQNSVQYIPVTKTLVSLFKSKHFRKMYFEYNGNGTNSRHTCIPGEYRDFCCGKIYQNTELFQTNPESLQIHLYTDDFEILPLKSKASVHKICAVYFTIRNLPSNMSYKMNNIYLVCLLNSNDLRSNQTDFNNVWEMIVQDMYQLETTGIKLDGDIFLKGNWTKIRVIVLNEADAEQLLAVTLVNSFYSYRNFGQHCFR